MYPEVYDNFVKREAGNYSVERTSDGAVLVRRNGAINESVCHIELEEWCTCNVRHCFESQFIHEYDADGGLVLEKCNPPHLMVDIYSYSHDLDEAVSSSVNFDSFTCALYNTINCTQSDSGVVRDQ